MKIIVFADSHGDHTQMVKAMRKHNKSDVVVFCGDGHNDIKEIQRMFPDKMYLCVRGNNDWCCDFAFLQTITLCGKKFLITHGHIQRVKESYMSLAYLGHQEKADIVLFGHTHVQTIFNDSKMFLINPGSVGYNYQYTVIEIDENTGKTVITEFPSNKFGSVTIP